MLDKKKCDRRLTSSLFADVIHAKEFIDSIVFNGGEPTEQPEALLSMCELAKEEGLLVKVQTNGSHPEIIKELVSRGIVDQISVDVKGFFKDYPEITGVKDPNVDGVKQTLEIASNSKAKLEIVIPVIEGVNAEDVPKLVANLADVKADVIVLQEFQPGNLVDPDFKGKKPSYLKLREIAEKCKGNVHIRTKLYGEEKA